MRNLLFALLLLPLMASCVKDTAHLTETATAGAREKKAN